MDNILLSETHFTDESYLRIPIDSTYHTNHPDGAAHGGSAIIVENN